MEYFAISKNRIERSIAWQESKDFGIESVF
jgi:hypothetical protein